VHNTIIISVWGDPAQWGPVKYIVEKEEEKGEIEVHEINEKYRSTLGALMKVYPEADVLLFISSTLGGLSKSKGYREMLEEILSEIKEKYLKNPEYCADHDRVDLKILPGIGRFKEGNIQKSFIGRIDAFRVAAFICAYEKMVNEKPERVILDISHGVNYMPVYVRLSVYTALLGYLARTGGEVKWQVYNSEPKSGDNLKIMLIENSKVKYDFSIQSLFREFEVLYERNFKLVKPNFCQNPPPTPSCEWSKFNDKVIKLVKTARSGLIIPFIEAALDIKNTRIELYEAELKRYSYLDLEKCEDIVSISDNELRYLYYPNLTSIYLISIAYSVSAEQDMPEIYDNGYCIDCLKKKAEKFFEEPVLTIVENEIYQLKERVELARSAELKFENWEPYNVFVKIGEISLETGETIFEKYRCCEKEELKKILMREEIRKEIEDKIEKGRKLKPIDKRNFIAHGSLERNITQIIDKEGKIYIKYNEEKRKEIENILKNIIL